MLFFIYFFNDFLGLNWTLFQNMHSSRSSISVASRIVSDSWLKSVFTFYRINSILSKSNAALGIHEPVRNRKTLNSHKERKTFNPTLKLLLLNGRKLRVAAAPSQVRDLKSDHWHNPSCTDALDILIESHHCVRWSTLYRRFCFGVGQLTGKID